MEETIRKEDMERRDENEHKVVKGTSLISFAFLLSHSSKLNHEFDTKAPNRDVNPQYHLFHIVPSHLPLESCPIES